MGDKKGKKDRAKENRQKGAKQAKAVKQERDRVQPRPLGGAQGGTQGHRGGRP